MDMEKLPDHQEIPEQEQPKYVPRPKSHVIWAWVLTAVVVIGVFLQFYWMMNT